MSLAVIAGVAVGGFAVGAYIYYRIGVKAVARVVASYEYTIKSIRVAEGYAKEGLENAHSELQAKLASIKTEVAKIEGEAKAEEQAVVARLKKLF